MLEVSARIRRSRTTAGLFVAAGTFPCPRCGREERLVTQARSFPAAHEALCEAIALYFKNFRRGPCHHPNTPPRASRTYAWGGVDVLSGQGPAA